MNSLGEQIRQLRETSNILLRQVAAFLEIDTALMSKMERGERRFSREQVVKLAHFYKVSEKELLTLWLSDKVISTLNNDKYASLGLNKAASILRH
jgi:transcriptional regulator with XRE-family HTH domain